MLEGYPLRKYDWKDWLLMALTSSFLLQVFAVVFLSYYAGYVMQDFTPEAVLSISINGTVYGTLLSLPLTLLVVYGRKIPIVNRKQLSKEESFLIPGLTKEDWKFLVKYIPLSYILYMAGSVLISFLFGATKAANQAAVESLFDFVPLWAMFLMIVVVAPVVEELFFRGMFLFYGDRLSTTWTRTLLSAVLFGMIHRPTDVYSAYTYIGMGLILSYAAKRTRAVEAAIVYHVLNNLAGFGLIVAAL